MGCIELCEDIHTAHRQKPTEIQIGFCANLCRSVNATLGPVHTERQHQSCGVASDITLIKLHRFLINQTCRSTNGLQPQLIRYDTSIDADISIIDA